MHRSEEFLYVTTSLEEVLWGLLLIGITMWIHGIGMQLTMATNSVIRARMERRGRSSAGFGVVVLASLMIVSVHLIEVIVWAAFLVLSGAMTNVHSAVYFALMQYTTVGSTLFLPMHWRLLEGMIAISGMMTFAWSTGILFALAQKALKQHRKELTAVLDRRINRGEDDKPPDRGED